MLDKIKNHAKHPFFQNFRDVRFLGFVVFTILVLLASWSSIRVIETNYELQKEIAQLDQQNQVRDLANANLKLKNEYYKTDTYLELQARKQFGKGAPGEKLLLVPKSVALAHADELPADEAQATQNGQIEHDKQPFYQKNFRAWVDFFRHKES